MNVLSFQHRNMWSTVFVWYSEQTIRLPRWSSVNVCDSRLRGLWFYFWVKSSVFGVFLKDFFSNGVCKFESV